RIVADGMGRMVHVDTDVRPGIRYGYRLGLIDGGAERLLGETWVDVPSTARFALSGIRPNPAISGFSLAFSLAEVGPARLEWIDLAGRRVAAREVGTLGPGDHVLRFD